MPASAGLAAQIHFNYELSVLSAAEKIFHNLCGQSIPFHFAFSGDVALLQYGHSLNGRPQKIEIMFMSVDFDLEALKHSITNLHLNDFVSTSPAGKFEYMYRDGEVISGFPIEFLLSGYQQTNPQKDHVLGTSKLPVVPYPVLVLQALQKWDHGEEKSRHHTDWVLELLSHVRQHYRGGTQLHYRETFPILYTDSRRRVERFFSENTEYLFEWQTIGFLIHQPPDSSIRQNAGKGDSKVHTEKIPHWVAAIHYTPPFLVDAGLKLSEMLRKQQLPFAFCGDFATYTYGVGRWVPRSIDILILSSNNLELSGLKEDLAMTFPQRLIYVSSSHLLQYNGTLGSSANHQQPITVNFALTNRHPLQHGCFTINGIPLVPYTFLLLEKLKEWDRSQGDALKTSRKHLMAMLRYYRNNSSKPYCKPIKVFDPSLHKESDARAAKFFESHSSYHSEWKKMGLMSGATSPLASQLTVAPSSAFTTDRPAAPSTSILDSYDNHSQQNPSKNMFLKCPPHISQLLFDWDNGNKPKDMVAREIRRFLLSIRNGKQTLITKPQENQTPEACAQVSRFFTENRMFLVEWQKMGFLEGYSSKWDVPPSLPKPISASEQTTQQDDSRHPRSFLSAKKERKAKLAAYKLAFGELRVLAARATVDVLSENGFHSAIFGSMACNLYGNPRLPNDVDILVLPSPRDEGITQEDIKNLLVKHCSEQFVLRAARDPAATYRVLYFRPSLDTSQKDNIKVDILLPGVMHLPALMPSAVMIRKGLPVLPFAALLLHKLQGWDDHRLSEEERYVKKAPIDAKDLSWLLGSSGVGTFLLDSDESVWYDRLLFSEEFERLSRVRVKAFCESFPTWSDVWSKLGFEVL